MAFATTGNDQTVGKLAARLFGVGERSKLAREAAEQLLALNPELKTIKELPPDTLIEVPEIEDAELKTPLPSLTETAPGMLVAGIRASTDALGDALAAQADEARDEANARLKTLRSGAAKRAAAEEESKDQLAHATAVAEAMAVTARASKAQWRKAATELRSDLDELLAVLADPAAGDR
jgi:hypothetical protein